MRVSNHAVVRFLERVKGVMEFSEKDFKKAYVELQNLFSDVISDRRYIVVPNYSKFVAVIKNSVVVTILDKFSMFESYEKGKRRKK